MIEPSALPAIWRIINQVACQRLGNTREELLQIQVKQLDAPENAATINNAQRFLAVQKGFGSFDRYIWSFVGGKPIVHKFKTIKPIPADHVGRTTCNACHETGAVAPKSPADHAGRTDAMCTACHKPQ